MENDGENLGKAFFEVELRKINDSLPRSRRPILELANEASPSYTNLAGETIAMNPREISELLKKFPHELLESVRLPIVILKESSAKKGIYLIDGNDSEKELVCSLINKSPVNKYLYRPDIMDLCAFCPSLITFGFIY